MKMPFDHKKPIRVRRLAPLVVAVVIKVLQHAQR